MYESFDLPVRVKGEELMLPARLVQYGYTHRFIVEVEGQEVAFEPDEERYYRALIDTNVMEQNKTLNIELLQAIAHSIETVIR
jgi:hypothetical protein